MIDSNKEIDLIELYQKILVFIFKNILTFIIFAVIGSLVGAAYYYKKVDIIKTSYLAETSGISKELVYILTDKITFDVEENNLTSLKKDLMLEETDLEKIKELSVDTTGNILQISVISTSNEAIYPFTEALVNFLNNQEYILEKQQLKQRETKQLLSQIEQEILNIEKFQKQFLAGNADGDVTINQIDGSHSEKLRLFEKKQKCEEILRVKNTITLINKDNNIVKRETSLLKILVISILIAEIFAFLYFFFRFSLALKNRA